MKDTNGPTNEDLLTLVAELVPDIPEPRKIFAEIKGRDRILWLEGWCDGCIAEEGFPPKGQGMLKEKLDHINGITSGFLQRRAADRDMTVQWSGFLPLRDRKHLYGVSWGIFRKKR